MKSARMIHRWHSVTILFLALPLAILAVETPIPERFLRPRDFNPHPITDVRRTTPSYKTLHIPEPTDVYANYLQRREPAYKNQEYLQYAPPDHQQLTQAAHAQFTEQQQREAHENQEAEASYSLLTPTASASAPAVQELHYPHVASEGVSHVSHYQAHNQHVTSEPEARSRADDALDEHIPKQYAFAYSVLDHHSGDDFSHAQAHNGHSTQGQYRVKLPDGRTQVVRYTADEAGYRAKVSYEPSPALHPEPVLAVTATPAVVVATPSVVTPVVHAVPHQVLQAHPSPAPLTYFKPVSAYPAAAASHYVTTPAPLVYPSVTPYPQHHIVTAAPYPYKTLTKDAYQHPTVTKVPVYSESFEASTVAPLVVYKQAEGHAPQGYHGAHVPRVQVAYNGEAAQPLRIQQSQQVLEQHHVYKRDN